ncbi:MAG: IS1634 family transposase [Bacilli bacterium]
MFLDCFKNTGKPYIRIVEGKYVKKEDGSITIKKNTIKNLGPLSNYDDGKPELLKRLREKFRNGELVNLDELNGIVKQKRETIPLDEIDFVLDPKNIGYLIINSIYNKLGIDTILNRIKSDSKIEYDLNGLTKLYVINRILNPSSKIKAFENRNKYLFPITSCKSNKEIYKPLDILAEYSNQIQMRMNTKIKNSSIGRVTDLTYYDVTNYYFETMYGDEDIYETDDNGQYIVNEETGELKLKKIGLRKKGVSKENRKEPIVQMGLFIDNNGIPVSHNLYPGNMQDKNTFTDIIKNSINKADLGRIVVVADNGMNTQENLYLLTDNGNGYIVSKSVKRCWKSYSNWIQNDNDYTNLTNINNETTFKYKSRVIERTLSYTDKETGEKHIKKIKEKEIVYWSKKHYERELHQNEKFIEYLESCKENPDKLKDKQRKSQEFIKVVQTDKKTGEIIKTKPLIVLLEDKIQKYKDTMGYYMIITSEIDTDDRDIINRYHGLSRIEDSFRIIKNDLEGRPVFVWTEEHIRAHFLICFIALTIIRIIQYKILKFQNKSTLNVDGWEQGITADKLKHTLKAFQSDKINDEYFKISNINEEMKIILNSFKIDFNFKNYTFKEIKELRKLINNIDI